MTFRKIKRVTKEGGPKMAKISGGVKNQDFGPPLRPKMLLTAKKVGSAQKWSNFRVG